MSKKRFSPMILLEGPIDPGQGPDPQPGSGQSTTDVEPWSFEMWSIMFDYYEADGDGVPGQWGDYVVWMTENGFADLIDPSENPNPTEP